MQDENVQIIAKKPISQNPLLLEGFPGIGLVGNIASQYIVQELEMAYLGTMDSRFFPPLTVMLQGLVTMPVRIYEKPERSLVVVTSDVPVHPLASYDVAKKLISWAKSINTRELVCLAGIEVFGEERRVFGAFTSLDMLNSFRGKVELFDVGSISGISGSVMNECLLKNIPALCLLGEVHTKGPDPRAAVATIEKLNELYGLGVNTAKLIEQAEQIELQMHQLAEQVQTTTAEEPKKEFPMYG